MKQAQNPAVAPETSPSPQPHHCHNPTTGDTEKPKGFSKRMPSPCLRSRELPFAVFLVSHCTISSLPAAPAELEISLNSSEAKKQKKKKNPRESVAISKGRGAVPAGRQSPGSRRAPLHLHAPCWDPAIPVRRGAGMNTSLVSADDFTSLACS